MHSIIGILTPLFTKGRKLVQKGIVQRIIMEKYWSIVIKTKHYESVENMCTYSLSMTNTHIHIHIHTDTHQHKCESECAYACIHTSNPHNIKTHIHMHEKE